MKMETNIVYQEDCIEGMKKIPSNSIDLVLTDPPYGITACEWDKPIDLEKFWVEIKRIIKPNGAIVMTASQPFTSILITSCMDLFKYVWVWDKGRAGNFVHANYQPLKIAEDIVIFGNFPITYTPKGGHNFNPQMEEGKPYSRGKINDVVWNGRKVKCGHTHNNESGLRFPKNIIRINNSNNKSQHPTQKPVELFKYLIKTYSNENQLVLDCFAGSGTTAIACIETNRKYICFENNPQYFKIINDRIKSAKSQTQLSNESCPTEPIICVKEDLLRKSPNSINRTFLNANIKLNFTSNHNKEIKEEHD